VKRGEKKGKPFKNSFSRKERKSPLLESGKVIHSYFVKGAEGGGKGGEECTLLWKERKKEEKEAKVRQKKRRKGAPNGRKGTSTGVSQVTTQGALATLLGEAQKGHGADDRVSKEIVSREKKGRVSMAAKREGRERKTRRTTTLK